MIWFGKEEREHAKDVSRENKDAGDWVTSPRFPSDVSLSPADIVRVMRSQAKKDAEKKK